MSNLTPISLILGLSAAFMVAVSSNDNVKFYGTLLTGVGIGGFIFSQFETQESKKQIENLQKAVDVVNKERRKSEDEKLKTIREYNALKTKLDKELELVREDMQRHQSSNNSLKNRVSDLENELKLEKSLSQSKIREMSNFSTATAYEIVYDTYKTQAIKLDGMVSGYSHNYPDLKEFFNNLESEIDKVKGWAVQNLEAYQGIQNLQPLIDEGLSIAPPKIMNSV